METAFYKHHFSSDFQRSSLWFRAAMNDRFDWKPSFLTNVLLNCAKKTLIIKYSNISNQFTTWRKQIVSWISMLLEWNAKMNVRNWMILRFLISNKLVETVWKVPAQSSFIAKFQKKIQSRNREFGPIGEQSRFVIIVDLKT